MTSISFYHLQHWPLERALPKLLEKTLAADKRAVILVGSTARAEQLANVLWSYDQDSWLPHGTEKDGQPENQPLWLTERDENPNAADFVFLTDGATTVDVAAFERCFEIFDGNDAAQVSAARERWAAYKDAGHDLTYLQQTETGGWSEMTTG